MSTAGERKGGTGWKGSMDTYTLPCVEEIAHGKMLQSTGSSAPCSDGAEGGMRGGWGGGSGGRGYMYTYS